eukprot:1155358-Pelagomonas_calceolata.AAC.8
MAWVSEDKHPPYTATQKLQVNAGIQIRSWTLAATVACHSLVFALTSVFVVHSQHGFISLCFPDYWVGWTGRHKKCNGFCFHLLHSHYSEPNPLPRLTYFEQAHSLQTFLTEQTSCLQDLFNRMNTLPTCYEVVVGAARSGGEVSFEEKKSCTAVPACNEVSYKGHRKGMK